MDGAGMVNSSAAVPWPAESSEPNGSLQYSSAPLLFPVNPWDIMLCMSGTVITCENAIVVAIIFYTPTLRTPMFVLIGSLATADLLAGVGLILNFVFQYVVTSEAISLITVGFLVASFTASISSLLAITVDRYLSLYNALTYFSDRTLRYVHSMLLFTIVRPLTRANLTMLAASFFLIFVLMLSLYVRICKIVCRHAQQIALQQHFFSATHYVATKKGVSTLAIILGTFGASWLPFATYCLVGQRAYPAVYTYATLLPATYNSMINPIIYAYRNQEIQRALYLLLCGCFRDAAYRSRSPSDV
ncbi:unnamed protein product [Arctogadus glacialis]